MSDEPDLAAHAFFRPWPYAFLVHFLLGPDAAVSSGERFTPTRAILKKPEHLSALITSEYVGHAQTRPPTINAQLQRALPIDIDADHAECPDSDPTVRVCEHCSRRVNAAINAITKHAMDASLGQIIWFRSNSRGAHGYMISAVAVAIPKNLRAAFVASFAKLTNTKKEVDADASKPSHFLRMPGTIGSNGVLAPIRDIASFSPLHTPFVSIDDAEEHTRCIRHAEGLISDARDDALRAGPLAQQNKRSFRDITFESSWGSRFQKLQM